MLENHEKEILHANKNTIHKWMKIHKDIVVTGITHCKEIEELSRLSARLNMLNTLKTDLDDILASIKKID